MSSSGFESLRASHPEAATIIGELERRIAETLRRDPAAILDEDILAQQIHATTDSVGTWLVELAGEHLLSLRLFWLCPNGYGTATEADDIADFPDVIECDRCGNAHAFNEKNIEVSFIASEGLAEAVRLGQVR